MYFLPVFPKDLVFHSFYGEHSRYFHPKALLMVKWLFVIFTLALLLGSGRGHHCQDGDSQRRRPSLHRLWDLAGETVAKANPTGPSPFPGPNLKRLHFSPAGVATVQ